MGRTTVKINLNTSKPESFLKILKSVARKNEELGDESPLKGNSVVNMTEFNEKLAEVIQLRADAEMLRAQSESKMQRARQLMGTDIGQNSYTQGTLYNMIISIKQILLLNHKTNEESLSPWGFNVVVDKAKTYKKREKGN